MTFFPLEILTNNLNKNTLLCRKKGAQKMPINLVTPCHQCAVRDNYDKVNSTYVSTYYFVQRQGYLDTILTFLQFKLQVNSKYRTKKG